MFRQILHGSPFFLGHDGCAGLSMGINILIFISGEVLYNGYNSIVSYVLFVNILIKKLKNCDYSGKYPSGIDCPKISLVVTSTDGQDGPNDASGAIVSADTLREAELQGLDSQRFLLDNDSYNFFRILNGGENQLKSGLTGTNLMDVVLLFVDLP